MANERLTEQLVRENFINQTGIIVEEQRSASPVVAQLLSNASKKGTGKKGAPEFIIRFNKNADFIIVVECKADINKHQSETKDHYADYAVDGALWYASFLRKKYDVLAVGVSGSAENFRVSHYLCLKDRQDFLPIFGDCLLKAEDYYDGYAKNPEKFRQDYQSLIQYTIKLNERLHKLKINESDRCILISCILLALRIDAFKAGYKYETNGVKLCNSMVNCVLGELRANIKDDKYDVIEAEYNRLKVKSELTESNITGSPKNILKDLVEEIDINVNNFIKTHKYYDALGELYVSFLRYANCDKGLGIVLTPPHITELFCDIAEVNKESIIFDNCLGTGGFLISAMRKMIKDAAGDKAAEKKIKSNQLFGAEIDEKMYCLASTNMAIHNDGKATLTKCNGLSDKYIKSIKDMGPTVGMLNPPYKGGKGDPEELFFVLKNLSALRDGGVCVAIVPMSCAIATKKQKIKYDLKKELLKHHTLMAVFSMPDDLFHNSNVNIVTCVMVFRAWHKHPDNYKTFFGCFKDDGFVKKKNFGRMDINDKWKEIKKTWVTAFQNRDCTKISLLKEVNAADEWCFEAYMETDYSVLNDKMFEDNIVRFITASLKSGNSDLKEKFSPAPDKVSLRPVSDWGEFTVEEFFTKIVPTKGDETENLLPGVDIPYIGAKKEDNGFKQLVAYDENYVSDGNCIVFVNLGAGSAGFTTYQAVDFIGMSGKTSCGYHKEMNVYSGIFISTVLDLERPRYSFGRSWTGERLKKTKFKLPVNSAGKPDWSYMEKYIKSLKFGNYI